MQVLAPRGRRTLACPTPAGPLLRGARDTRWGRWRCASSSLGGRRPLLHPRCPGYRCRTPPKDWTHVKTSKHTIIVCHRLGLRRQKNYSGFLLPWLERQKH